MEVNVYNGRTESVEIPKSFKDEFEVSMQSLVKTKEDINIPSDINMKYGFTGKEILFKGKTLKQIIHLKDKRIGGFIEKEENLSQNGACWIDATSVVHGDVSVKGDSQISNFSELSGCGYIYDDVNIVSSKIHFDNCSIPCAFSGESYISNCIITGLVDVGDNAYLTNCNIVTQSNPEGIRSSVGIFDSVNLDNVNINVFDGERKLIRGRFAIRRGYITNDMNFSSILYKNPVDGEFMTITVHKDYANLPKVSVYDSFSIADFQIGAFQNFYFTLPKEVLDYVNSFWDNSIGNY